MTVASVFAALFALLWCTLVFLSAVGWGGLALRVLRVRQARLTAMSVAGLALLAFVGGLLNLAQVIYPKLLIAMVLAGALLAVAGWLQVRLQSRAQSTPHQGTNSERRDNVTVPGTRFGTVVLLLLAALFVFRYASTVHRTGYQGVDDYEAYLLFPAKMLETHHFAADPFNERRLQSSLGPPYFLQDLALVALPLESTQMLDQGIGLLLLLVASLELPALFGFATSRSTVWLFALAALAMPHIRFNLTMTTLPAALLLAAAVFAAAALRKDERTWVHAALIGASAALIIGCKSTYVPHVFFFCAIFYALELRRRSVRRVACDAAVTAILCIVVLLPWAVAMHTMSGTYFYPISGHGYDYTSYYHLPSASSFPSAHELLKIFGLVWALALFLAAEFYLLRDDELAAVPIAITAAALLGTIVTGWLTGGDSLRRYNYPCILPALLLILAFALRQRRGTGWLRPWLAPAAVALLAFTFISMLRWENIYREMWADLQASLRPWSIAPVGAPAQYAALQTAMPPDSIAIETLDYPFLLDFRKMDFRKQTIYSADFTASASLPPGWPIHGDGEALANYLAGHGIRYIAYSYGDQAFLADWENAAKQTDPAVTQAWRNITYLLLQGHRQYRELAETRRHIYDDGHNYVLDLATPR